MTVLDRSVVLSDDLISDLSGVIESIYSDSGRRFSAKNFKRNYRLLLPSSSHKDLFVMFANRFPTRRALFVILYNHHLEFLK